jgi:hypothetical protein
MARYRLAYRGQSRLEIPSGDSDAVVKDVAKLVGHGVTASWGWRSREHTRFSGSWGLIKARHYPGGFYTTVRVEDPPKMPIPWLALHAYKEVSQRNFAVNNVARPTGLLAVSTTTQGLASKVPDLREQFPDDFEAISVVSINPVIEGSTQRDHLPGPSHIQVYSPGMEMPAALDHLAIAAEHLQPGSLNPDPRNELSKQIGWEGYDAFSDAWEGAMGQETAFDAARFCMLALRVTGPVTEY